MAAKRKYRWEEWFDRPRTTLVRGVDYRCSQSMMSQQVRSNASARGVSVRVADTGDSIIVEVVSAIPHPAAPGVAGGHVAQALANPVRHQ